MPNEFSSCKDILFRSDYQETCSVCVAHASRIIACPLGWTGVAPRISVFSISPLKFSQSTRRADWNFRKKNVSYAPGDSSKYFRQLPFLFFPVYFSLFVPLLPRGQTRWSVLSCRVASDETGWKKREDMDCMNDMWAPTLLCRTATWTQRPMPQVSRGFTKDWKDPLIYLSSKHSASISMVLRNDKKMTISNGFRNYKTSCWNVRQIYAFQREIAVVSGSTILASAKTDAYYARIIHTYKSNSK